MNNESSLIKNAFPLPDRLRHTVAPDTGNLYCVGGFLPMPQPHILKNTLVLDEHRSFMVGLKPMKYARCDHAQFYFRGSIFAMGGMS